MSPAWPRWDGRRNLDLRKDSLTPIGGTATTSRPSARLEPQKGFATKRCRNGGTPNHPSCDPLRRLRHAALAIVTQELPQAVHPADGWRKSFPVVCEAPSG